MFLLTSMATISLADTKNIYGSGNKPDLEITDIMIDYPYRLTNGNSNYPEYEIWVYIKAKNIGADIPFDYSGGINTTIKTEIYLDGTSTNLFCYFVINEASGPWRSGETWGGRGPTETNPAKFKLPDNNLHTIHAVIDSNEIISEEDEDNNEYTEQYSLNLFYMSGATKIVDDEGDGNYRSIQAAIDASSFGDKIEVYSGTYDENIEINKMITIEGKDVELGSGKDTGKPIIRSSGNKIVRGSSDGIVISGFEIKDGDIGLSFECSHYNKIRNNVIANNNDGIKLGSKTTRMGSTANTITDNEIENNDNIGICTAFSYGNDIRNNLISNNNKGIALSWSSFANEIVGNNIISNTDRGIYINETSFGNTIYRNNFIDNDGSAQVMTSSGDNNRFYNETSKQGNYWDNYEEWYENKYKESPVDEEPPYGIWDETYVVPDPDAGSRDKYPFVEENGWLDNLPPETPTITGTQSGKVGEEYIYTVTTTDPDGDRVYYMFDWDDGTEKEWIGWHMSGEEFTKSHTWNSKGTYNVRVKSKDINEAESEWSDPLSVSMPKIKNKAKTTSSDDMIRFKKIEIEGTFISTAINKILFPRFDLDPVLVYLPSTEDYKSDCVIKKITITYRNGNQEEFVKPDDGTINRIDICGRLAVWDIVPKVVGEQYKHSVKGAIYFGGSINTEYI